MSHSNRNRAPLKTLASREVARQHDHDYSALLIGVQTSFDAVVTQYRHLFRTDVEGLNEIYLDSLPEERQVHNCHACKEFLRRYGGLVAIDRDGSTMPAMWSVDVPEFYAPAFSALSKVVKRARVKSVFLDQNRIWGTPITGKWSHMSVTPPTAMLHRDRVLTSQQAMAAAIENYRTVVTSLTELKAPVLDEALRILRADALARSEKFVGPVQWLRRLHDRPRGRSGENVLWAAIAAAPEGYCHPRSSVLGPLLADIAAGLPFDEIKSRFEAMMHPLRYQRPQVNPSVGNIKAAETLVAKLGIAPSLERRFARLDECQTLWRPKTLAEDSSENSVFGHIKAKDAAEVQAVDLPSTTMTWEKFERVVLPNAAQLEMFVPVHGNFVALLAAANADAPPIIKWDREDARNSVSVYVYHGGSLASQWGLLPARYHRITAVVPAPNLWGSHPLPHLGDAVFLILEGAVDCRQDAGNALFPEILKDELHGVRSTIEAYSKTAIITGREEASACGYALNKSAATCRLRAYVDGHWNHYNIDRWD